jgi:acetylornithine/N-succinyldiaminopimelate aminotransferase
MTPRFHEGLRVTDDATRDVAVAVLSGLANRRLTAQLRAAGVDAVGLSGVDGGLLGAAPHEEADTLGAVGRVTSVAATFLAALLNAGRVPVVAPIAADAAGTLLNINADDVAAALAAALGAHLVLLSDVSALVVDGRPVTGVAPADLPALLAHPDVTGGMRPKLRAAARALEGGAAGAVLGAFIDAESPLRLLEGSAGTTLVAPESETAAPADAPDEATLLAPVYPLPRLELVRGRGARVVDAAGREYLDFVSGIAVNAFGHADPGLARALAAQASTLIHVSNLYGTPVSARLAARLLDATGYDRVFFCNSGTEGVEGALKFARQAARAAGRAPGGAVLAFEGAFHGRTAFALSATANPAYREPFEPLVPGVVFAPYNDTAGVDRALADAVAAHGSLTAILVEPIQGEAGAVVATPEFLRHLRRRATECGALLVFDEIQCGVGRTGHFLAGPTSGVRADITVLAKGLGGGVPVGAVLLTEAVAGALAPGHHGTTFGGNPLAAAAANYILDRLLAPGVLDRVGVAGRRLSRGLAQLVAAHPSLLAERGAGLLRAVELGDDAPFDTTALVAAAREEALLLCKGGAKSVRLLPPLDVSDADIDLALARLDRALSRLEAATAVSSATPNAAAATPGATAPVAAGFVSTLRKDS